MSDLWSFLKARLDEDEQAAREAATLGMVEGQSEPEVQPWWTPREDGAWSRRQVIVGAVSEVAKAPDEYAAVHIARHDPARVLAEVEVKRRIMRAHEKWCEDRCEATYPDVGPDAAYYWAMKAHASVYADHPDYLEEWRA